MSRVLSPRSQVIADGDSADDLMDRLRNALHPPLAGNIASLALRYTSLPKSNQADLSDLQLSSPLYPKELNHLLDALARTLLDTDDELPPLNPIAAQLALFGWAPNELASDILSCRICQRRLGMWSFTSGRQLDLVEEHLSWCPIRSSEWWNACPLVNGGRASVKDVRVSQAVQRPKWLKR